MKFRDYAYNEIRYARWTQPVRPRPSNCSPPRRRDREKYRPLRGNGRVGADALPRSRAGAGLIEVRQCTRQPPISASRRSIRRWSHHRRSPATSTRCAGRKARGRPHQAVDGKRVNAALVDLRPAWLGFAVTGQTAGISGSAHASGRDSVGARSACERAGTADIRTSLPWARIAHALSALKAGRDATEGRTIVQRTRIGSDLAELLKELGNRYPSSSCCYQGCPNPCRRIVRSGRGEHPYCTSRSRTRRPMPPGPARHSPPRRSGSSPRAAGSTARSSAGATTSSRTGGTWRIPGKGRSPCATSPRAAPERSRRRAPVPRCRPMERDANAGAVMSEAAACPAVLAERALSALLDASWQAWAHGLPARRWPTNRPRF